MDGREEQAIERMAEINHGLVLKLAAVQAENALLKHEIEIYRKHIERMVTLRAQGMASVN